MRKLDLPEQSWAIDDAADEPIADTQNRSFHYGG
jgi:hypothetical protein